MSAVKEPHSRPSPSSLVTMARPLHSTAAACLVGQPHGVSTSSLYCREQDLGVQAVPWYTRASLVAQTGKSLPAIQETQH